jgi:hypothetical protein
MKQLVVLVAVGLVAGCSCSETGLRGDSDSGTDMASDPGSEATVDATEGPVDGILEETIEDIVWEECPAPSSLEVLLDGPMDDEHHEMTIDADGTITAISADTSGRMVIEIDFSASDPELGTAAFTLPSWVADTTDLSVDDEVHVIYHYFRWFWPWRCFSISRDGTTIVASTINDFSCSPIDDPDSFTIDDISFLSGVSDCVPHEDDCASWRRMYYDLACPDLEEGIRLLDGSDVELACGPGYRVALPLFTTYHREINPCTDMPGGKLELLVVRR